MAKFKILRIKNGSYYVLLDENTGKLHTMIFEFHNMNTPKINDCILFNEKLLNPNFEGFAQPYALRIIKEDELPSTKQIDIFKLETNGKTITLKRIYG